MTTEEKIRPILFDTYGKSGMSRALAKQLAEMVDKGDFDSRGREHNLMLACWNWFSGGSTAAGVAHRIEEAL